MKETIKIEIGIILGGISIMSMVYLSLLNIIKGWGLVAISYIIIFIFGVIYGKKVKEWKERGKNIDVCLGADTKNTSKPTFRAKT